MSRLVAVLLTLTQLAAAERTFQGTATIDGKTSKISYACAFEEPGERGPQILFVLLIEPSLVEPDVQTKRCGNVESRLRSREKAFTQITAIIRLPEMTWDMVLLAMNRTASSMSIDWAVEAQSASARVHLGAGDVVRGRLWIKNGWKWSSSSPSMGLDATFSLPLERLTPMSAELRGAQALRHPATLVAKRYFAAMASGDEFTLLSLQAEAERQEFDEILRSPRRATVLETLRLFGQQNLSMAVATVVLRGADEAEVNLARSTGTTHEKSTLRMRLEKGTWRIGQP